MSEKSNETINDTIDASQFGVHVEGVLMKEKRYLLTPLEHKVLSEEQSEWKEWSKRFLLISLGLLLTIFSKLAIFLYDYNNTAKEKREKLELNIESWEIIYLIAGLSLSLILFGISKTRFDNSERKKVMIKIKKYFDEQG